MDDEGPSRDPALDLGPPAPKQAAYRVLARKYRPQTFDSLIGQEAMVRTLSNAFAKGRIAHAFMLTGVRGVGKTTTARIIARALNCIGPDGRNPGPTISPCGQCEPCTAIAESRAVDVLEMDAASRTGIDDIREIVESVRYAPAATRFKVYIIDEVHMLSKAAFNGLLKTLEEPPPHVKFIFATTEIRKVPVTVLSRCQRFDLRRIPVAALSAHLGEICMAEGVAAEPQALALIARAAEGSVRDALSLLDQAIAHGAEDNAPLAEEPVRRMLGLADRGRIVDLYAALMRGEAATALAELRSQYDAGAEPLVVVQDLLEYTHWLTRLKLAPETGSDGAASDVEVARGLDLARQLAMPQLARTWSMLLKGVPEVRDAPHPIQAAEMLLVRLAYVADLPAPETLVRQLREGGPGSVPAPAPPRPRAETAAPPRPRAQTSAAPARAEAMPQAPESPPAITSLAALAALAGAHLEPLLKRSIERHVRLVRLEPGQLDIALAGEAPRTLAADLTAKLRAWTGQRWVVSLVNAPGSATLAEEAETALRAAHDAVAEAPLLRAVLAHFPEARITAIRAPEAPAAAGGDDDDDSD